MCKYVFKKKLKHVYLLGLVGRGVSQSTVSHSLRCHTVYGVTQSTVSHCLRCVTIYGVTQSTVSHCLRCVTVYGVTQSTVSQSTVSHCLRCHTVYGVTQSTVSHCLRCVTVYGVTQSTVSHNLRCHKSTVSHNLRCHTIYGVTQSTVSLNLRCHTICDVTNERRAESSKLEKGLLLYVCCAVARTHSRTRAFAHANTHSPMYRTDRKTVGYQMISERDTHPPCGLAWGIMFTCLAYKLSVPWFCCTEVELLPGQHGGGLGWWLWLEPRPTSPRPKHVAFRPYWTEPLPNLGKLHWTELGYPGLVWRENRLRFRHPRMLGCVWPLHTGTPSNVNVCTIHRYAQQR